MSVAGLNRTPWNKGITGISKETSEKMSKARLGKIPANKNIKMTEEQRVKLSCSSRGIHIEDFDHFITNIDKAERNKFSESELHMNCFKQCDFTCDCCDKSGVKLNAHHKNSWKHFPEQRFEPTNLVSLCEDCHRAFHLIYGNGKLAPNTEEQYGLFKDSFDKSLTKKTIYILTGAPASGKSWVGSQVTTLNVLDSDTIPKRALTEAVSSTIDPLLLLTVGVSTFIKRNPQYTCKLIVIREPEATIVARMMSRNGRVSTTIQRRIQRMEVFARQAEFVGTSVEVLTYINSITV